MTVRTQYYTAALNRGSSPSSWLSTPFVTGLDGLTPKDARVTVVIHGPYSRVHVERVPKDKYPQGDLLVDARSCVYHPETGQQLCLPFCEELYEEAFSQEWQSALRSLDSTRARRRLLLAAKKLSLAKLAGEYHPVQLGDLPEGFSVDPVKFLLTFLVRVRMMLKEQGHTGRCLIVLHPDSLLFLGHGEWQRMRWVSQCLSYVGDTLGLELVYENVVFENPVFTQILPWMVDPRQLVQLLPRTSGLCVDTKHLAQEGWSEDQIATTIHGAAQQKAAVVHIDASEHCSVPAKAYVTYAYSCGIPVVPEAHDAA